MAGLDEDVRDEAVLHSLRRRLCRVLGPKAVGDEEPLADILHRIADGKVAGPGLTPHQTAQEVIRALASIAGAVRALQDQSNEEENEACVPIKNAAKACVQTDERVSSTPIVSKVYKKRKRIFPSHSTVTRPRSTTPTTSDTCFGEEQRGSLFPSDTVAPMPLSRSKPRQHREIRCDAAKVSRRATIDASELDKLRELYSQVDREPLAVVSQETTSA